MFSRYLTFLLLTITVASGLASTDDLDKAKALFKQYVALETAYDPAVADLYVENAVIRNKRIYPTGQVRELTIPAAQYKTLIRTAMPLAKARGDYSTYSETSFTQEGQNVRIRAIRFSVLKQYSSPISILIGPDSSGMWAIFEELSESQP